MVSGGGSSTAPENADVMAVIHQFFDGINQGDPKSAVSACAAQASIVDAFPPYFWQGPTACSDWEQALEALTKKSGMTQLVATLKEPRRLNIVGDRAYVVVPASVSYQVKGKRTSIPQSVFTITLQNATTGWRITAWAWADR